MTKTKKEMLMNEINELWINGHGGALSYWADREVRLYKQGLLMGAVIFCGIELAYHFHFKAKMEKSKT